MDINVFLIVVISLSCLTVMSIIISQAFKRYRTLRQLVRKD